jgi:hypothetical protein
MLDGFGAGQILGRPRQQRRSVEDFAGRKPKQKYLAAIVSEIEIARDRW